MEHNKNTSSNLAKKDTVLNGDENGLTSYFNFQENSGSIANDTQTQSNNDGSIKTALHGYLVQIYLK